MPSHHGKDWDNNYSGDPPAWDIGRPQPVIVELAEQGRLSGRVLDVGCGTGEHAILAAEQGASALGVDVSPLAIERAFEKARKRGVTARFAVADALRLSELGEMFDVVIDSGLFHVFDEDERPRYAASLTSVMRSGGMLYITCISDQQPGDWGPHRVSEAEIRATFRQGWVVEDVRACVREISRPEIELWSANAWLAIVRRVEAPGGVAQIN